MQSIVNSAAPTPSAAGAYTGVVRKESAANDWSPLMKAVAENNSDSIKAQLAAGINVNAADDIGNTPLHLAVILEELDIAKLLLANGADVNIRNSTGYTPLLTAAAQHRDGAMCQLLIEKGADVNVTSIKPLASRSHIDEQTGETTDGIRQQIGEWESQKKAAERKAIWDTFLNIASTAMDNYNDECKQNNKRL